MIKDLSSKCDQICALLQIWSHVLKKIFNEKLLRAVQTFSLAGVNVGGLQDSIVGTLLLLIYINHLADGLSSNANLFGYNTSLFPVVNNANTTAKELNNDLENN